MCALNVEDVIAGGELWRSVSSRKENNVAKRFRDTSDFLDRKIPLDGASHADVENYTVEIPTRYAACFAILTDGRKVKLKDCKAFVGWSGWERRRSYLFRNNGQYIEVTTNPDQESAQVVPGNIRKIILGSPVSEDHASEYYVAGVRQNGSAKSIQLNEDRKFIAPDGNQVVLAGGCLMLKELA